MIVQNIIIRKIIAKEGYLLTNGQTTSNAVYLGIVDSPQAWWEIPDPDYIPEADGTYLHPYQYSNDITVTTGMWYYEDDKDMPHEAIKDGVPANFDDTEYFDIV